MNRTINKMRSVFAVIAITLLSLSSCYLNESYTVDVLKAIAQYALDMHRNNFPEDHRFDSFKSRIQDLSRLVVDQLIEKLGKADRAVLNYIENSPPGAHQLEVYNLDNLANIALYFNDYSFESKHNLDVKIFNEGMTREELIVTILKLRGNHEITAQACENILSKYNYTAALNRLNREEVQRLIIIDNAIQKFYFGEIIVNVNDLSKNDIMMHINQYLNLFPELGIIGVLEKITKVYENRE